MTLYDFKLISISTNIVDYVCLELFDKKVTLSTG